MRRPIHKRSGFTLAEAAITIAIVGIGLTYSVQALKSATITSAHTQYRKIARELALQTLGEIAAGQWWEEIELEHQGSFAENDYPDYQWELALADEEFPNYDDGAEEDWENQPFDSLKYKQEQEEDYNRENGIEEDEDAAEPYERIRIKVRYPSLPGVDSENFVVLERWIPWVQVYGPDEEADVPQGALNESELPGGSQGN
jgi:prepilin-type N-terminal cleavage/methylation domain-containing protein